MKLGSFTPIYDAGGLTDSDTDIAIPLLLFNFLTLMMLQFLPCCCKCCLNYCYPVHQLTALDPNDPFELIEWPLPEPDADIEMQEINHTSNVLDQTGNDTKLSMLPIEGNFKCIHCGKVNQFKGLIERSLPEPETNIEFQVVQSSNSVSYDIENDETKIVSETKNDIKLPVLPDITACK